MEDAASKVASGLATVVENESPGAPPDDDASDSVVEKDGASASAESSSSEELMFVDESTASTPPPRQTPPVAPSPFRSAKLPPRAPVCAGDVEVEGVLPSQPSIVRRMQETNKHDVDSRDVPQLLPSLLLNSGSLDLDGSGNGVGGGMGEDVRVREKFQEETLLNLLRQKELEKLLMQQQEQQQRQQQELQLAAMALGTDVDLLTNALNERCRLSPPPGFQPFAAPEVPPPPPTTTTSNYLFQQMMHRPRHNRSASDPTFAFNGAALSSLLQPPAVFPQATESVATTPLMDQADALPFLNRSNVASQDWPLREPHALPTNLGGMLSVPKSMPPEMPKMESGHPPRRRKHGPSKSVDFNVMMKQNKNKNNGSSMGAAHKERGLPTSPPTGSKSVTRADVKKLVEDQTQLGRPTYAPWFRPNRKSGREGGDVSAEMQPGHHRTQSMPHEKTGMKSPKEGDDAQRTPKSGRAGTGVFFPRMPKQNEG